jgi:hypothetical protein
MAIVNIKEGEKVLKEQILATQEIYKTAYQKGYSILDKW